MSNGIKPIEVGDRWEDNDSRQGDRVVRVVEKKRALGVVWVKCKVEVAELNPSTVGRTRWLREGTLRSRYHRQSR